MLPPLTNNSHEVHGPLELEQKHTPLYFVRQFMQQPITTGAIAPSSRFVARKIAGLIDFDKVQTVVELGPGTGVFTEQISARLNARSTFFAIEINPSFVEATRKRCPQEKVYHDSALNLPNYLVANNRSHADCVVSSLPWTIFDPEQQEALMDTIATSLRPGGMFVSIIYLGGNLRARGRYFIQNLPFHFNSVQRIGPVWNNTPPTLIYRCIK